MSEDEPYSDAALVAQLEAEAAALVAVQAEEAELLAQLEAELAAMGVGDDPHGEVAPPAAAAAVAAEEAADIPQPEPYVPTDGEEQWRPAVIRQWPNLVPLTGYRVSDQGRVSDKSGSPRGDLKPAANGRTMVSISSDKIGRKIARYVYQLVAWAFCPQPSEKHDSVDHINRDCTDDRAINLRWATVDEQANNRTACTSTSNGKKVEQIDADGNIIKLWDSIRIASTATGVPYSTIHSQCATPPNKPQWRYHVYLDLEGEMWSAVEWPVGSGHAYTVSNLGRVRDKRGVYTYGSLTADGYHVYDGVKVSDLVAAAFVVNANPAEFKTANHLDGVKTNNRASNLEWTSRSGSTRSTLG